MWLPFDLEPLLQCWAGVENRRTPDSPIFVPGPQASGLVRVGLLDTQVMAGFRILLGLLASVLVVSCRSGEPQGRFEPVLRIGEERGEISAEIGDETRYLLSDLRHALVLVGSRFDIPSDGVLSIHRVLSRRLAGADRLVVATRATLDSRSWSSLPLIVAPVTRSGKKASIDMELRFPREMWGAVVRLHGVAWVPHPQSRSREESEPITVPRAAILEIGGGVLAPGRGQGDLRFTVEACRGGECTSLLAETVGADSEQWTDWKVSLADFAGQEITLAFETVLLGGGPDTYSLALWSRPTVFVRTAARARPNVILLSIDTLRADHLSSYGYGRDTAPKIREWFEEPGVIFDNTVAAATTTGPSHMTMFTSLMPTVHGIAARPGVRTPAPLTIAEVLRANGFVTGAITEDGPLHALWGFSRGFDSYAENKSSDVMLPEGHIAATFGKAERWLRLHADKPFFLFLHTFEVHYPYTPPARYAALFGNPERVAGLPAEYAPELYDREIRHTDDQLDSFLRKVKGAGLLDNTIFIVTSDHGEEFLEHGFIGHGGDLHPEVLHVPLLMRGPGIRGRRRIDAPVGHTDMMPTILSLLEVDSPTVMMGRDLAAVVRGESDTIPEAPLYSEAWYQTAMLAGGRTRRLDQPAIAVRRGNHKVIRKNRPGGGGFDYQYFDLSKDPHELSDLLDAAPNAVAGGKEFAELRGLLAAYELSMEGVRSRSDAARDRFSRGIAEHGSDIEVDPAVAEKLRALGYVE